MGDLERRTVITGVSAVAALAVIAPCQLQAMPTVNPDELDDPLTHVGSHSNSEPGQYWVWFGGHWDLVQ